MTTPPGAPSGDPLGGARVEMYGASRDSSKFTQIGNQVVMQPLRPAPLAVRYSLPPEDRDRAAGRGELVAVAASDAVDDLFTAEPAQVIRGVPAGVVLIQQAAHALGEGAVVEAADQLAEPGDGGQGSHHPGVAEPQRGGVLALGGSGGPGHPVEGGHIGSGQGVGGFSVTQTLVGVVANGAQGSPVVVVEPPPDTEVAGVANDGFSP